MRVRLSKCATIFVIALNLLLVYYSWKAFTANGYLSLKFDETERNKTKFRPLKRISKLVTLVITDVGQENDITATIQSLLRDFPNLQIIVLSSIIHTQLKTLSINTTKNVRFLSPTPKLYTSYEEQYPLYYVKTKYVLFVPDSTRIVNRHSLQNILNYEFEDGLNILALPIALSKNLDCLKSSLFQRNWTLILESTNLLSCDVVLGHHAILVERNILRQLPNAFLLPFPYALYFQTASLKVQVKIHQENGILSTRKPSRRATYHQSWKLDQDVRRQLQHLYGTFDVKLVRRNRNIEWYGCSKDTASCLRPDTAGIPLHIYQRRSTPPCCLANLRKAALHLFGVLEAAGIRYWLSGSSLLGAIKGGGDVVQWDVNVDVGVRKEDVGRCRWLVAANSKPTVDSKGFLWERLSGEGVYRVYYSRKNRIYANVFVFGLVNNTMSMDGTSLGRSATNGDFPDRFLHPMSSIEFLGRFVPTPNNINDFLEMQFGREYLEDFKYPEPENFKLIL